MNVVNVECWMSNVGVQNDSDKMHMHIYSTAVTGALSNAGASIKRGTSRSLPVAVQLGLELGSDDIGARWFSSSLFCADEALSASSCGFLWLPRPRERHR